jgi:hypothetical protein
MLISASATGSFLQVGDPPPRLLAVDRPRDPHTPQHRMSHAALPQAARRAVDGQRAEPHRTATPVTAARMHGFIHSFIQYSDSPTVHTSAICSQPRAGPYQTRPSVREAIGGMAHEEGKSAEWRHSQVLAGVASRGGGRRAYMYPPWSVGHRLSRSCGPRRGSR